jgi:hypothetical protein
MASAISDLNISILPLDRLLRVREIIPSDTEAKALQGFDVNSAHPAEICLFRFSQVSNIRGKVNAMMFMNTVQGNSSELISSLSLLRETAGQNFTSRKYYRQSLMCLRI